MISLHFFECEPELRDGDEPWIYNDALYSFRRGRLLVSFALAPSQRDVRLILKLETDVLYELNGMDVKDVVYHHSGGQETREIIVKANDKISVRLKPAVLIRHDFRDS